VTIILLRLKQYLPFRDEFKSGETKKKKYNILKNAETIFRHTRHLMNVRSTVQRIGVYNPNTEFVQRYNVIETFKNFHVRHTSRVLYPFYFTRARRSARARRSRITNPPSPIPIPKDTSTDSWIRRNF